MWALSPTPNPPYQPQAGLIGNYVIAVRLRLGCPRPAEPALCGYCDTSMIDGSAFHVLLCAKSVTGHNAVRDQLHGAACACDPCAEMEQLGLSLLIQLSALPILSL